MASSMGSNDSSDMPSKKEELEPRRRDSDRPRGKLRKGMYILPSLFTTANIAAGFYAILQTIHGSMGRLGTWILPPRPSGLRYCSTGWTAASRA